MPPSSELPLVIAAFGTVVPQAAVTTPRRTAAAARFIALSDPVTGSLRGARMDCQQSSRMVDLPVMTALLDPTTWPIAKVEELLAAGDSLRVGPDSRSFRNGIVVGSTGPLASYAGARALEAGGSAVDAALVTALTQVALAAGCWVSYAGRMTLVHYEAATGEVLSLDGGYKSFREETDPGSIPFSGVPSGRTALVPGFFSAAQEAHNRFGTLPWADLFLPALWVAEGVPLGTSLAGMFQMRKDVLVRTPEARAALTNDGAVPVLGDTLRQPELYRTLRMVAEHGADYIYTGPWAQKFVEIVRREGGKVVAEDLADYRAQWGEPLRAWVNDVEVAAVAGSQFGGAALIEGLKVAAELGLGDPATDAEALHLLTQICRTSISFTSALPPAARITDEHAQRLAKRLRETGRAVTPTDLVDAGSHSDFVCAVDGDRNAVAVGHTINTVAWGSTGIFVDGISIPDSAAFQQLDLERRAPGDWLPSATNPAIVLKDGKPVLLSASIGAGLAQTTLTSVHRFLAGVPIADIVSGLAIHGPYYGVPMTDSINNDLGEELEKSEKKSSFENMMATMRDAANATREAIKGGADLYEYTAAGVNRMPQSVTGTTPEMIEQVAALGTSLHLHDADDAAFGRGMWGGVAIDDTTGQLHGGRSPFISARVEGI
jgi:gamma-glutamyltranspeptidase/glutathione hydrolase